MAVTAPIKCVSSGCSETLAHQDGAAVHIDLPSPKEAGRIKGLLQPGGQLTVACPACGTLNNLRPGRPTRGSELIEKEGTSCVTPRSRSRSS